MQFAAKLRGWAQVAATVALVSLIAACGGGGGSSSSSSSSSSSNNGTLPASPSATPVAATASNTAAITVGTGVANVINIPTVSVTVCVPGTSTCQTINNVQVDTGSYGLRIASGVLTSTMQSALPVTAASSGELAECTNFADGYSWGSVRTATVTIAGETTTTSIPIQVLGDLSNSVPTACASGSEENTVAALGANGILGIGVSPYDCGTACVTNALDSNYYACPTSGSGCTLTTVSLASQVANPVAKFPTDNNGVIVEMSPVSNNGAGSATGTLVFGIGTQSNNTLAAAKTFTTDAAGDLNNSSFNGSTLSAFFDSGSNAYFFTDSTLALCSSSAYSGFYCPSTGQTRTVTVVGLNGASAAASIGILSAATLFGNGSDYAFNDLAGQIGSSGSFDIGLPFFYGRYMYFGIASSTQSPYVGY